MRGGGKAISEEGGRTRVESGSGGENIIGEVDTDVVVIFVVGIVLGEQMEVLIVVVSVIEISANEGLWESVGLDPCSLDEVVFVRAVSMVLMVEVGELPSCAKSGSVCVCMGLKVRTWICCCCVGKEAFGGGLMVGFLVRRLRNGQRRGREKFLSGTGWLAL